MAANEPPPFTVAMFRALADLMQGPAYSQPSTHYYGEQPGRIYIRRRTINALYVRHLIDTRDLSPGRSAAEPNEIGRAFFHNHPLRRELKVTA